MKFGILLLTAGLLLTGCGVKEEMSEKMDGTLDQIKKTNEIVKQQCVALTFEGLLKPEFGIDISPVAFDLIPFAKKFGECTSAEEITEVLYLWGKKLNEVTLPTASPTEEQAAAFNKHKDHVFSALQAVAGLLSQEKVDQIVAAQIDGDGRFVDTAYELLMLRTTFIQSVMLDLSLLAEGKDLNSIGKLQKAIEYADTVERIARLPYARPVDGKGNALPSPIMIKISAYVAPRTDSNAELSFDPGTALNIWKSIRAKANLCYGPKKELKVGDPDPCPSSEAAKAKLTPSKKAQLSQSLSYVNSKILGWGGTLD